MTTSTVYPFEDGDMESEHENMSARAKVLAGKMPDAPSIFRTGTSSN